MAGELTVNSDSFEHSLARILATTKRAAPAVLREQARGVLKHAQLYTPPGHQGVTGQKAKQHGEGMVEGDIRTLMFGVNKKKAGMHTDIAAIHRRARNRRTGRVSGRWSKIPVAKADLDKYIASKKKMVGFLASGWNEAAGKLGFKPPQWIWRHAGQGSVREISTDTHIAVYATNQVGFASRAIKQMDRLLRFAYSAQKGANDGRWKTFIETQTRKALKS